MIYFSIELKYLQSDVCRTVSVCVCVCVCVYRTVLSLRVVVGGASYVPVPYFDGGGAAIRTVLCCCIRIIINHALL